MEISKLKPRPGMELDRQLMDEFTAFENMILELSKKEIPLYIRILINQDIAEINGLAGPDHLVAKVLSKRRAEMLQLIARELKYVTKNHYRNVWVALGMMVIGAPLGIALGAAAGNMALFPIGLPLGLLIGMMIGSTLDKTAFESGRQLDLVYKS